MNSYERVLEESRQRLRPDSFLPAHEMGKYSLRSMVQFSELLGTTIDSYDRNRTPERQLAFYRNTLKKRGIRGANKASILFGSLDRQYDILALPIVEEKYYSSLEFTWHDNSINAYKGLIGRNGGHFQQTSYPEFFGGEALLVDGYDKPIIEVVCRARQEDLEARLPLIEKLSVDFPEAMFCVRSHWLKKFIMLDDGVCNETPAEY